MKKFVIASFLIMASLVNAQQLRFTDKLPYVYKVDFKPLNSELAGFSKNYKNVFGEYNFTFDSNNYGQRNVYVGYDNKFYYQRKSTFIMESPGPHNTDYSWDMDCIGGLVSGYKLIFKHEKNYTKSYSDYIVK